MMLKYFFSNLLIYYEGSYSQGWKCNFIVCLADFLFSDGVILHNFTKTCLYNVDPVKPHFYILKLGFTGVYIIFLMSA